VSEHIALKLLLYTILGIRCVVSGTILRCIAHPPSISKYTTRPTPEQIISHLFLQIKWAD